MSSSHDRRVSIRVVLQRHQARLPTASASSSGLTWLVFCRHPHRRLEPSASSSDFTKLVFCRHQPGLLSSSASSSGGIYLASCRPWTRLPETSISCSGDRLRDRRREQTGLLSTEIRPPRRAGRRWARRQPRFPEGAELPALGLEVRVRDLRFARPSKVSARRAVETEMSSACRRSRVECAALRAQQGDFHQTTE